MKLLKTSATANPRSGLSFLELMLTVGILAVIFAAGAPVALGFYLDYQFDSEYELLFSLLQQSRNFSMVNYNEADHGVYWNTQKFILFEGPSFGGRDTSKDRVYPRTSVITISGPSELVFSGLSGTAASSTYTVSDNRNKTRDLYVNPEGLVYNK